MLCEKSIPAYCEVTGSTHGKLNSNAEVLCQSRYVIQLHIALKQGYSINIGTCTIKTNKMHFPFLINSNNLSCTCFE